MKWFFFWPFSGEGVMCLAMPSALRVRNWPFYMWPPSETRPEMVESNATSVSAATCLVM
jgi:hypothetical protein